MEIVRHTWSFSFDTITVDSSKTVYKDLGATLFSKKFNNAFGIFQGKLARA
jgi:hypothetical protein